MKLSEIKVILNAIEAVDFKLEDGTSVPENFHITEIGIITKDFIDCGGKARHEKAANFQLWDANDYDHRLKPQKLLNIISLCENKLGMENLEIEVEYQTSTIGKYNLGFDGNSFILISKNTACLAEDSCRPSSEKVELNKQETCCTPGGGCC